MGGDRPFDDDRFPDQDGHACCFLCGKKVDPRDPLRGTYTPNAKACEPLPAHLTPCLEEAVKDPVRLAVTAMSALQQMGDANVKRARAAAGCSITPPVTT